MDLDNSDDIDDDWFYESITRYKTLQMFNLQNIPEHVFQIDETTLCIASKNLKAENSELLQLKIPRKLTLSPEDEGRSKENDFKMLAGLYTKNRVYQTDILNDNKILTSEDKLTGLQVYKLNDESTSDELISELKNIPWKTPNFAVNRQKTKVICSKCNHEPLKLLDINVGKCFKDIKHPFHTINILPVEVGIKSDPCTSNNITCEFLSSDLIGILNMNNACLFLHDIRTENSFSMLPENDEKHSKEFWTLSSYDLFVNSNYFGILSNCGNFYIYDIRNNKTVLKHKSLNVPLVSNNRIKLKFANDNLFSISGFDSDVHIFNVCDESFNVVFKHDGHHQKKEAGDSLNYVNDHIWLTNIGDKFLLSICDNKSLHCWEFNE